MTDQETMALCAIRYCIGRRSYIVSDGCRWAMEWGEKSPHIRAILIRDLEEQKRRGVTIGDEQDHARWLDVLAFLLKLPEPCPPRQQETSRA